MRLITSQKPNIFALNTFFYSKLVAAGFDGVTNWVKEVKYILHQTYPSPDSSWNTLVSSHY